MNIGFIGCGSIAHFHAEALIELGIKISAVSSRPNSPNISQFSKKYNIKNKYSQWEKMVQMENLDALWVVVSWHQMDSLLIPLIQTGIPLFLEKPVALSSKKIKEAIDSHAITNQYIQIGYNRRFYPFIEKIRSLITSEGLRTILVEIPESVDSNDNKLASNLWFVNSSHVVDLLYFFLGPLILKYKNNKSHSNSTYPSSFNAILETEDSVPVHLTAEWNSSNNFGITFFVDNKRIVLKPLEMVSIYNGFDVREPSKVSTIRQYKPKLIDSYFCKGRFKPGFYEQAEYFIGGMIRDNKIEKSLCPDLYSSYKVSKIIEQITS